MRTNAKNQEPNAVDSQRPVDAGGGAHAKNSADAADSVSFVSAADSNHSPLATPAIDSDATAGDRFSFDLDDQQWFARLARSTRALGPERIGPYEILAEIGRGGQGVVYKARQPRTGREIVLKRLVAGAFATPEMRARFEREIRTAAALNHPNVVTVYGCEIIDDQLVLTMEWIDGVPFSQWATGESHSSPANRTSARRGVREVLRVFAEICDAVHHAHERGIIHRDLKPTNILIDAAGRPHVLDFGLAKLVDEAWGDEGDSGNAASLTLTGHFVGTPAYAAPEQFRGKSADADARTDVYALGAVLNQALTGRTLFPEADDLADLVRAVREGDPPRPSALDPRIVRELDLIVLKAVSKDPAQRYATVAELADDVRRQLSGRPVLAHPPSATYRLKKFIHRRLAAVLTVGGGAVLIGAVVATYVASERKLTHASEQVEEAQRQAESADLEALVRRAARLDSDRRGNEAESLYRDVHEKRLALVGPMHESTAAVALDLGQLLHRAGRFAEALPLLSAAFETRRQLHGDKNALTLSAARALGDTLFEQADYQAAEPLYWMVGCEEEVSYQNHSTANCRPIYSTLQFQLRWADAIPILRACMETRRRHFAHSSGRHEGALCLASDEFALGRLLRASGQEAEAQSVFESARQRFERLIPSATKGNHVAQYYARRDLGFVLVQLDRLDEAEGMLRAVIPEFDAARHRNKPERRGWALAGLGECLLRAGRFDEAEPLLLEAQSALAAERINRLYAALRLIDLYDASGQPAKAAHWRACVSSKPTREWAPPGAQLPEGQPVRADDFSTSSE